MREVSADDFVTNISIKTFQLLCTVAKIPMIKAQVSLYPKPQVLGGSHNFDVPDQMIKAFSWVPLYEASGFRDCFRVYKGNPETYLETLHHDDDDDA